MTNNEHHTVLR